MDEEIEILKTIYEEGIITKSSENKIDILIYAKNTDDESEYNKKYLRLNMIVAYSDQYPDEVPSIELRNVKGLTDDDVASLNTKANELAKQNRGNPMLYEIIEAIRDELTNLGSLPKCINCAICLYDLEDQTLKQQQKRQRRRQVIGLECYHFFHINCLKRHVDFMQRDIDEERTEAERNKIYWKPRSVGCPTCRQELKKCEIDELNEDYARLMNSSSGDYEKFNDSWTTPIGGGAGTSSSGRNNSFVISDHMRKIQANMRILFEKQKEKNGIIVPNEQEIIILNRPQPPPPPSTDADEM